MSVEKDRLLSLVEFAQQSALLRSKPAAAVSQHGHFALHEHQIQGLPGIRVNISGVDSEDDIWLAVERLRETRPPEITSAVLRPWVRITQSPTEEPRLLESAEGARLIAGGTHSSSATPPEQGKPQIDPDATIILSDYEGAVQVRAEFETYLKIKWHPWAREEKCRHETIALYFKLFTLKQQLEGGIVEAQLELVWGVGVGTWNHNGTNVHYPLISRLVELWLNPETAEVEIRPRDIDTRLELDWYASVGNPGVSDLEKAAKDFFGDAKITFSPFDRDTFEPLLRSAAANLDANGIYWPDEVSGADRTLPKPDDKLQVTDTWVVFARPRTNSLFLQDLEKLKKQAEETEIYPPAVTAIVTDPDTTNVVVALPPFRGVSASYHVESSTSAKEVHDLYFPKRFNDEQVRIVQLLEVSPGVVVQGPPGTGKTHTIANIICHYLATGKRVLVTSMKDPALAVLREQLPDEIRPLAISLLTSEQEGMKQFEHAIRKIASELQALDRGALSRAIQQLEELVDALHGKLAFIDRKIGNLAKQNLARITLETEEIDPQDAAGEVVENAVQFEWIPDALGVGPQFAPQFADADIVRLREARRALGPDINYLGAPLPQVAEFPDPKALLQVHQDLSQFEKLKQDVHKGVIPALADSRQEETLTLAQHLLRAIETLRKLRKAITHAQRPWMDVMHEKLRGGGNDDLMEMLEALGADLEHAVERRTAFLERPVTAPARMELDTELVTAVGNLADGRKPFGLITLFGKSIQKKQLDSIRVLGNPPVDTESWKHVAEYLALLKHLRELGVRWNALGNGLHLEAMPGDKPEDDLAAAAESFRLYLKVKDMVAVEGAICRVAARLFPTWPHSREVADDVQRLSELEKALRHHLTKHRLAQVWVNKERIQKVLGGRTGPVVNDIRGFLADTLGNPNVTDAEMQARWSALMDELSRVLGLNRHLATVREVCDKVEASGASKYAELLKQPLTGTVDSLLPDNWRKAWQLRRLGTYLESIDAQEDLKKLTKDRHDVESDLSRAYRDIVMKRTWLNLAENASPSIRAALQAYLNAIQKIGKGTGKRAVRYRHDARMAASLANPAVPCWIMAHYRVSESLPAELGCFDLVVIDEASQSDLTALPALLRAQKMLIVGDDKQVSPEGVGLEEEKIHSLMNRFLAGQVETYRPQMSPERSIYDLFKVVFAKSAVMLKEHFRCVGPIIEYSKREFYNHELRPLRLPKASERLDPPLIDVLVENGYRKGDVNLPEARFIIDEIKAIVEDPNMVGRSIGVVSLLGDKQALEIWHRLTDELGLEVMQQHRITCGDARTFQGKERDIMFLSMVSAPNEVGAPLTRDTFAQRFNVAASRARDRMFLVHSVEMEHLSESDRLRRSLIAHFAAPFAQDETRVEDLRQLCESPFEREMYDELTQRGYWVTPQVRVGQYRIDMVVEGHKDARLAVECDGDRYHGPDKWTDDMQRQRVLERAGWTFWRCFASAFIRRRNAMLEDLLKTLVEHGIDPIGAEEARKSVHTEHRNVSPFMESAVKNSSSQPVEVLETANASTSEALSAENSSPIGDVPPAEAPLRPSTGHADLFDSRQTINSPARSRRANLQFLDYVEYAGPPGKDPRVSSLAELSEGLETQLAFPFSHQDPKSCSLAEVSEGLVRIIEIEGPVIAKRVYEIYLTSCGIKRMDRELKSTMNRALAHAIRQGRVVHEDEAGKGGLFHSVVRVKGSRPIRLRNRGPRSFEDVPPSEVQVVARYLSEKLGFVFGSDEHLRAILKCYDLKRLTTQTRETLLEILERGLWYVDEFLSTMDK